MENQHLYNAAEIVHHTLHGARFDVRILNRWYPSAPLGNVQEQLLHCGLEVRPASILVQYAIVQYCCACWLRS